MTNWKMFLTYKADNGLISSMYRDKSIRKREPLTNTQLTKEGKQTQKA